MKEAIELIKKAKKENATKLDLSRRDLIKMPDEVFELTNLTRLNLNSNQLTEIPEAIGKLTSLTELYLGDNQLSEIPEVIGELTSLTSFCLNDNQLSEIPEAVGKLTSLTSLHLWSNQLSEIPEVIGKLTSLTELVLRSNQITEIPETIGKLTSLTELYLNNNQLSEILEAIGELTSLTNLGLRLNQLSEIPEAIGELTSLTNLGLRLNQITEIPEAIEKLTSLTKLELSSNQIKNIPIKIANLFLDSGILWEEEDYFREKGLLINNNPLKLPPPEIIQNGTNALRDYFKSIEKNKKILNEVKVLLVGEGAAGKTSLLKQLRGRPFNKNEPQTHGINIDHDEIKTQDGIVKAHYWDFGGQEIMHAAHQFFLSKRSLYVLLIDKRREEKNEYWLKLIESFGGSSPIILVLNKMDENPSFNVNRKYLSDKYKNIKGVFHISCENNTGIEELQTKIAETLTQTSLYGTVWAPKWFEIKEHLEKETSAYIPYEKYSEICKDKGLTDGSTQQTLIRFLNDLGSVVHFDDPRLEHTHVLKPRWITEAVYRIINSESVANNKGVLRREDLKGILKKKYKDDFEYPLDKHDYIIDLMKKFEICYPLNDKDVLLPGLLDVNEPEYNFKKEDALNFIVEYDFLPKSIFPRFMISMYKSLREKWRTGFLTEDKHSDAASLVTVDEEQKIIYIYVNGEGKRDYFAAILYILRDINDSFEKLEYKELVPMPDNPKVTVSYEHLLYLAQKGTNTYEPDGARKEYKVSDLLGLITYYNEPIEKILEIMEEINNKIDKSNPKSIKEAINRIVMLKPNFFGLGIDFNEILNLIGKKEFNNFIKKIKDKVIKGE